MKKSGNINTQGSGTAGQNGTAECFREELPDFLEKGDIVEFETGQVAIHISKIAGCCTSIDESDYPKERYIGRVTDVHNMMKTPLRTKTYTIVTTAPIEGFYCTSIFHNHIIRMIQRCKDRKDG